MENANNVVYQGEFYKLNESRKRLIGTKADTWKPKYLIFYHKGDKPVLEYHKKKPKNGKKSERTLTDSFELWPSYKVEKLHNARGRAYVCEITSPDVHIFLSADEETQIDVLVFLLQIQIRLKENIKKEFISVVPDDSDSQQKIGAKGSKCVLHASPWGLTLVLEQTRALLSQWPLKSIRYYEASGAGNFSIEAGRVAPMGEGLFSFKTQPGDDDLMYNLLDSYIVNTLDRVKPTQKGTPEEIEDYIREHDCLHSLTTISVCSPQNYEIRNVLKRNWDISFNNPEELTSSAASAQAQASAPRHSSNGAHVSQSSSTNRTVQSSSLVINLERPGETSENRRPSSDSLAVRGHKTDTRVTVRPPPPPSRSGNSGVPRRSQRREHSIPRKIDVVGTNSEGRSQVVSSKSAATGTETSSDIILSSSSHTSAIDPSPLASATISEPSVPHHTEFYNLSSPNMKVRVSKSPVVIRHPNKVGRAEYLLSVQQSGVRTPASADEPWDFKSATVGEDDQQEAADYLNEISRASWNKYGGQNPVDNPVGPKLRHDLSTSEQSVSVYSCMDIPVAAQARTHGYANLQSSPEREVIHSRQRSAPETMLDTTASWDRQKLEDNGSNFSPSLTRQKRKQTHEDRASYVPPSSLDSGNAEGKQPHSSSNARRKGADNHSQNMSIDTRTLSGGSEIREDMDREVGAVSEASNSVDESVSEWLMSASCEDLSDHMRTVIYDGDSNGGGVTAECLDGVDTSRGLQTASSTGSSNEKPPLPFTGLKKFHDHAGAVRDRSKSFGYMNIPVDVSTQSKPQSSAPSAHLIRKMVNARAHQETLRKSLSNPNFLNLGSKEHLFSLKSTNGTVRLAPQQRQKSKSFGSLFPAIKKALSRESLGHSRSTTPERRNSRSNTPERRSSLIGRRSSSDADSNFRRQTSFHSFGEMTIKGIRMTERSRSFRRVRGAKSLELLSGAGDEADLSRLSSATTVSSPPAAEAEIHSSTVDPSRTSASALLTGSPLVPSSGPNLTLRSNINPPVESNPNTSSASDANSISSVHLTQTTVNLPPLPTPVSPPPLPAPRKKVSEDETSKINRSTSSNFHETSSYQNTFSLEQNSTQKQHQRVSDSSLESEVNAADQTIQNDSKESPALTDLPSGDSIPTSYRSSHAAQRNQAPKHRISLASQGTGTAAAPDKSIVSSEHRKHSNSGRVVSYPERKSSSGSLQVESRDRKSLQVESREMKTPQVDTRERKTPQVYTRERKTPLVESVEKRTSQAESREMKTPQVESVEKRTSQAESREMKTVSQNENETSNSLLYEPKTVKLPSMPKPFQPIPFRKHQNGVRSVQAPSRPSKP